MENKQEIIYNMDAYEIQKYQQNRYPLLFVDKMLEIKPGEYAKGLKNFSYNEWFFPAHFADEPNVPGFVQYEAMAQTFIMTFLTLPGLEGKKTAFIEANNVKYRKKIIPGDAMYIEAHLDSFKRGLAKGHVEGRVDGELAVSANLIVAVPDVLNQFRPKSVE